MSTSISNDDSTDIKGWNEIKNILVNDNYSGENNIIKNDIINVLPHAIAILVTSYLSPKPPPVLEDELIPKD